MTIEAAPIVVQPSGKFLGDVGKWATFLISAGSPPTSLQVLPSTQVASTWVVATEGCGKSDAANCTETRGGTYDVINSKSFNVSGLYGLGDEVILGYDGTDVKGTYGYDKLEIQSKSASVSVDRQVIAAITTKEFYVGNLGLSTRPISFDSDNSNTTPSLLTSLKNQKLIPSLSYGYTAGASYQQENHGVNGSLTLGGYDASRFTPNDVTFTFAPTDTRQLVVGVQAITYSNSKTTTTLLSDAVLALVDSTVPYLWLPEAACTAFEDAFGITWDPIRALYRVNETLHDSLLEQNPSVVFELANGINGGPSVNVTLPYASFDLEVSYPVTRTPTRYFPLQRASDDSKVTLGRTFFQESFLIVDYEHKNFSVSQAVFDPNIPSHIVSIISNDPSSTNGDESSNLTSTNGVVVNKTSGGSHGIGTGAIAGIAIAIILIISIVGAFFFFKRRNNRKHKLKKLAELEAPSDIKTLDTDQDSKQDYVPDLEVKKSIIPVVTEQEVPMTPPLSEADGNDYFTINEKHQSQIKVIELPGSPGSRSELSSPEPWSRSELATPDPEAIRSELSTPDPAFSHSELPTPDPSHELESPGISITSSSRRSPPLNENRHSLQRPLSDRMDSSESEAGFTRDGFPTRPFHRRLQSNDSDIASLQSRPRHSRMDSSDSESGFFPPIGLDESSESEPIVSPVLTRPHLAHLDPSSDSEGAVSLPSTTTSQQIPRRPVNTRMDSSDSEAPSPGRPSPPSAASRQIRGLVTPFHSSSSYRPAIRRSVHAVTRPFSHRSDSSDGELQQTWLDSPSTDNPSDISRFTSLRSRRGVNETMLESPSTESGSDVSRFNSIRQPRPVSGVAVSARNSLLREEDNAAAREAANK